MEFNVGMVSDVGTTREINQDSACVHFAETLVGQIAFGVICDGMGGLSEGEYASSSMIHRLEKWYAEELPELIGTGLEMNQLRKSLETVLKTHNEYLIHYGEKKDTGLGTTVSALLLLPGRYFGIHVGDSRIYEVGKRQVRQITSDHSRVMQDVRMGLITPTEAERDTRKNQLLQCIGARGAIRPEFIEGNIEKERTFVLCSDGFVHKISNQEIWKQLRPNRVKTNDKLEERLKYLVSENMRRQETDNITALAIRVKPE